MEKNPSAQAAALAEGCSCSNPIPPHHFLAESVQLAEWGEKKLLSCEAAPQKEAAPSQCLRKAVPGSQWLLAEPPRCQVGRMPAQGGRDVPWITKLAKASTALVPQVSGFGDSFACSHPTPAVRRRHSSKEKLLVLWMCHREASRASEMQEGLSGIMPQPPRAALLQARRQRDFF